MDRRVSHRCTFSKRSSERVWYCSSSELRRPFNSTSTSPILRECSRTHARRLDAGRYRRIDSDFCGRDQCDGKHEVRRVDRSFSFYRCGHVGSDSIVDSGTRPGLGSATGSTQRFNLFAGARFVRFDRCRWNICLEQPGKARLVWAFFIAVFDNIPLTALALKQGGYDWGFLAYTVGFGGSMLWFGSSCRSGDLEHVSEARSVGEWLRHGWIYSDRIRCGLLCHALDVAMACK